MELYQGTHLPMGFKSAPAYFQQQMQLSVLINLLCICCKVYLDDIMFYGASDAEFFNNLQRVQ